MSDSVVDAVNTESVPSTSDTDSVPIDATDATTLADGVPTTADAGSADAETDAGTVIAAEEAAADADASGPGEVGDLTLAEQEAEAEVVARRRVAELRARPRHQSASLGGFKRVAEDARNHYWESVDEADVAAVLARDEQQHSSPPSGHHQDEAAAHSASMNSDMPIAHTAHAEMANVSASLSTHDEL